MKVATVAVSATVTTTVVWMDVLPVGMVAVYAVDWVGAKVTGRLSMHRKAWLVDRVHWL